MLSKFDRGEYVEPTQQTVAEYVVEWLKAIEPTVRPSTFESYSRNMNNHVVAYIGAMRLTKVDAVALNGLYAQLLATGRRQSSRSGSGYSPKVADLARKLRAKGMTLQETADYLRLHFAEPTTSPKTPSPPSSAGHR